MLSAQAVAGYVRDVNVRVLQGGSILALILAPLFWLADRSLFSGSALLSSAKWRVLACALALVSLLAVPWLRRADGRIVLGCMFIVALLHAVNIGIGVGSMGGVDSPMFLGLPLLPLISTPVVAPLWFRCLGVSLVSLTACGAFFCTRPDQLAQPAVPLLLAIVAFATFMAIAIGYSMNQLLVANRIAVQKLAGTLHRDERLRIARELHDGLGQVLSALRLECSQSEGRIVQLLDEAGRALRAAIWDLRPQSVTEQGIVSVLRDLIQSVERRTGADCEWDLDLEEQDLAVVGQERIFALYRIVQEALTNVARHAQAKHVSVRVALANDALVVEVVDDGVGIDRSRKGGGCGVLGMQERAASFGGYAEVLGAPGKGTTVRAVLPVDRRPGGRTA